MWSAIVAALKAFAALIGMKDRADARKAGQQEQEVATLNATIETKKRMDDANASGMRTPDDVDRSLRAGRF